MHVGDACQCQQVKTPQKMIILCSYSPPPFPYLPKTLLKSLEYYRTYFRLYQCVKTANRAQNIMINTTVERTTSKVRSLGSPEKAIYLLSATRDDDVSIIYSVSFLPKLNKLSSNLTNSFCSGW